MNLRLRHYVLAIALHVIVFAFVFIGVRCSRTIRSPVAIQGEIVSSSQVKKSQSRESTGAAKEAKRKAAATREARQRQRQLVELRQQQQVQQEMDTIAQRAAKRAEVQAEHLARQRTLLSQQIQKQKKAEMRRRAAAEKAAAQKAEKKAEAAAAAARRSAEEVARKAAAQKAAEAKAREEAHKQAVAQARKKAKEEARKKAAAAKEKAAEKARAEAQQKQREAALEQQIGSEAQALKSAAQRAWIAAITEKLRENWVRPPSVPNEISATVAVTLQDNGHIVSVEVTKSSGNVLYDDSVRRAVLKSDPLPLPDDPQAFDPNLSLTFTPQELQGGT